MAGKSQKEATATLPQRKRILLVDDHPMIRERLRDVIESESDFVVCGEAEDRHEALEVIQATSPDLAIIDLSLKSSSGLELIKDVHVHHPKLHMLVVSMHDESLYAERVLRAGARGYMTKQEATQNVLQAIRRVLNGDFYLSDKIASQIVGKLAANSRAAKTLSLDTLTDRELQVYELSGQGLNTRQVAGHLCVDVKTVETYRGRIKEKLGLKDYNQFLQSAIRWSLAEETPSSVRSGDQT